MNNRVVIGLVAGLVAAVLYVTVGTGSLFALLLFYLAPLPLFIVGFGWGTLTAAAGSGAGTVLATLVSGFETGMLFMATVALPVVGLVFLGLLSRPSDKRSGSPVEWYPLGRLVLWICVMSTGLVAFAVIILGPDAASFEATLREWFNTLLEVNAGLRQQLAPNEQDLSRVVEVLVWGLPPASAALWMLTTIANMWLASLVVERSGHTIRPMDSFSSLDLPGATGIALGTAIAISFLPGLTGIIAASLAAVLVVAFTLQGLAVIHVISRGNTYRPALLGLSYLVLLFTSWIGVALAAGLGLAEAMFGIRNRFTARGAPPGSSGTT